jgi:ankyrin repeat protein
MNNVKEKVGRFGSYSSKYFNPAPVIFVSRIATAAILYVVFIAIGGCGEVQIKGKTAKDVFSDPKVVELVNAACAGDAKVMDEAIRGGANVNAVGYRTTPALIWVMESLNKKGIEKMLQLGANPNLPMQGGETATWFAAGSDDPELLRLMLKYGGDPNIEAEADTALQLAVKGHRVQNIELLLAAGADINKSDAVGRTAVTTAAALEDFEMVYYFLEKGYFRDLTDLARWIEASVVAKDSEAGRRKQRVLKMLEDRGVEFPLPAVVPPPPPDVGKLRREQSP